MTFFQFLNNNMIFLWFIGVFFGRKTLQAIADIFLKPILKNRLEIEQERTKQAKLDSKQAKIAPREISYTKYDEGYMMEQEQK